MYKTIYLTGAPSAGKSSLADALSSAIKDLDVWQYGERLTEYIRAKIGTETEQAEIRSQSSLLVTPDDVAYVDLMLLNWVQNHKGRRHLIIDSHPVTKETYGYRITAFNADQIRKLGPDEIWVLFTPPNITVERIRQDPQGRPLINEEEARLHSVLQASVASQYGVIVGCPVYLLDSGVDRHELVSIARHRLGYDAGGEDASQD